MTPEELIAELEQAAEGSRELDIDIHKALGWELAPPEAGCTWWNTNGDTFNGDTPHYTTSLDAALTLVPDGRWEGILTAALTRRWLPSGELEPPLTFERFILRVCREALKARQADG